MKKNQQNLPEIQPDVFHGAAFLDADGNEIPITENMISEAFDDLIQPEKAPEH